MSKIESLIKHTIPEKHQHVLGCYKRRLTYPLFYGKRFVCPICGGHFRKFLKFGYNPRPNAQCPRCGSVERHRLLWLYLNNRTDFFTASLQVLDISPRDFLQREFRARPNLDYVSIDLEPHVAMLKMDVMDLKFPDYCFDCVICYHVLEHVHDDLKAMREIFRVLKTHGWAIVQVPILGQKTIEGKDINSPEERARLFGQPDHFRQYGLDYKERLQSVGFTVKVDNYVKSLGIDAVNRYRLNENEDIYFCLKV